MDTLTARGDSDGEKFNVRWILIHLIEEYARHAGHADILREDIDGEIGDCDAGPQQLADQIGWTV